MICSNVLGGCAGSTGPASINPETGRVWGPDFPPITIGDMVRAQARLLDELTIDRPIVVIGGSIGGFQALEWIRLFPRRVRAAAVIAAGTSLNAMGLAFNRVGSDAIRTDSRYAAGRYEPSDPPIAGLAAARKLAHLTYRTPESFDARFGREQNDRGAPGFAVHAYLEHKGRSFAERFDANAYLTLIDAMNTYDAEADGDLADRLAAFDGDLLVAGFSSDRLFPPAQSERLASIARDAGVRTTLEIVDTRDGHDAFLMPCPHLDRALRSLLDRAATHRFSGDNTR